ncbi:MAG: response regulator [gamma proteobacterium symbiont of Clathrolucina costata]
MYQALITFLRANTTIKFRIYLFGAVMLAMFFTASIFSFINHMNDIAEEKRHGIVFVVNELLTKTADQALWRGNAGQLESVMDTLISSTQIRKITVFDVKGEIFTEKSGSPIRSNNIEKIEVNVLRKRVAADFGDIELDLESVKDEVVKLGTIHVEIDKEAISDVVWSAMMEKSYALFIAVILSIPVSYLLAMSLVRPLRGIMSDLQNFESGEYKTHDGHHKYKDEYALLSRALIRAGESIERKTDEIKSANCELKKYSEDLETQIAIAIDARKAADEANARKDIFVANISHELKTPLTGVVSGLDLVEQNIFQVLSRVEDLSNEKPIGYKTKKELRDDLFQVVKCVDIAKYSGAQIEAMVNEILASIQDIYDEVAIDERPVRLNESLRKLIKSHELYAKQKGLEFEYSCEGCEDVWILTDWIRVAQILNAMISNSTRFTERGTIKIIMRILATSENVSFYFEISDTGIGITASEKDAIFNLFHIGENPRKKTASGIGTGLAIAKRITEKLGGTISLKSSVLGKGSCFTFDCTFKRYEPGAAEQENLESQGSHGVVPDIPKLHLLYVEDSFINQQIFQQYCMRFGVNLMMANNGQEGFEKYLQGNFDALVIDCYMPVMNGFDLVKKIREHERKIDGENSLILALTADSSDKNRKRCLECGFDEFIAKPFSEQEYRYLIRKAGKGRISV